MELDEGLSGDSGNLGGMVQVGGSDGDMIEDDITEDLYSKFI